MENWYQYEDYQTLNAADALTIEESYSKIYGLLDQVAELYDGIERIVEHDRARREYLHFNG